jgi:hypothetical protein
MAQHSLLHQNWHLHDNLYTRTYSGNLQESDDEKPNLVSGTSVNGAVGDEECS